MIDNLHTALQTLKNVRHILGKVVERTPMTHSYDKNIFENYDAAIAQVEEAIHGSHQFHMRDGSTFTVSVKERPATGENFLQVVHDANRSGSIMMLRPTGGSNSIHIHSVQ
jgi:hypothetical protein